MRMSKQMIKILEYLYEQYSKADNKNSIESGITQRELGRKLYNKSKTERTFYGNDDSFRKLTFDEYLLYHDDYEPFTNVERVSLSRTIRNLEKNEYIIQGSFSGIFKHWHITEKGIKEIEKKLNVNNLRSTEKSKQLKNI